MSGQSEMVVFDCVVYAQAIINPNGPAGACLELARNGAVSLCISDYVLEEIRQLPAKIAPRFRITPAKVEECINDLIQFSRHMSQVPQVYVLDRDPDDSHYINLALAAGAKLITSRDRDLLDLMNAALPSGKAFQAQFPDLRVLTPEELLRHVRQP